MCLRLKNWDKGKGHLIAPIDILSTGSELDLQLASQSSTDT